MYSCLDATAKNMFLSQAPTVVCYEFSLKQQMGADWRISTNSSGVNKIVDTFSIMIPYRYYCNTLSHYVKS